MKPTLLFLSVFLLSGRCASGEPQRFTQDRFVIGFWVEPPADESMATRYRELAQAHFNTVISGLGPDSPEPFQRLMALCDRYDLHAIVSAPQNAQDAPDQAACIGYGIRDEPNAADFPALRARVDALREVRPGRLGYINLFPNYATPEQLDTATYEEHVARFIAEVNPDVLSMDHYPQFRPGADGRDNYCANLAVMREQSLKAGIPYWNFFNTMPYGVQTDPTEDQLRWQIYTTLAYGAKGIMYFCYYTPGGGEFPKGGAILLRDGRLSRHYDQAKRINARVANLGRTLMRLTSTGVLRLRPDDDPAAVLAGAPIRNVSRADYDPPLDLLVGVFKHEDGRRAVMLNNYAFAYTAWPTVEFDGDAGSIREVSQETGLEQPVVDDSPDLDGLQVSLDAGEGRLFLMGPE